LETSGGQSSNLYLILFIFSTPELSRHLWQLCSTGTWSIAVWATAVCQIVAASLYTSLTSVDAQISNRLTSQLQQRHYVPNDRLCKRPITCHRTGLD
jgi:hypothetical protein